MNPEFLIRIIVRARNEIAGVLDKAANDIDKVTGAQERNVRSSEKAQRATKDLSKEVSDLQQSYHKFTDEVAKGEKDYDTARFGLKRLSDEMDRLAKKAPIGSQTSESLHKSSLAAQDLSRQLQVSHETDMRLMKEAEAERTRIEHDRQRHVEERRQREISAEKEIVDNERRLAQSEASDRVRIESERQRLVEQRRQAEIKAEQDSVRASEQASKQRSAFVMDILGAVRERDAEMQRNERSLSDFQVKEAARVESSRASSRAEWERTGVALRHAGEEAGRADGFFRRLLSNDFSKIDDWDGYVRRLESRLESSSFSVAKLDNRLRGLLVAAVFAFFQQLVSVTGALAGTLISVASAAVQAGEALGGAFVAGAAQALPVIGLLVAAWGRVGAVFKAVQQAQKDAVRANQEHQQAATAQANAADRVRTAQQALADAQRRVTQAQEALTKARRDSTRQLEDLIDAERRARLEAQDAERQRRRDIQSGNVDAEVSNDLRVQQTRRTAQRASTDLGLARSGDPTAGPNATLIGAQRAIADATRGVASARAQLRSAKQDATDAAQKMGAAHALLQGMLAQLDPTERRLYESMRRIQQTYRRVFRPITDIIVSGLTDAVDRVNHVLTDNRVIAPLTRLARQIRTEMGRVVADLTSNRSLNFFHDMADQARRNLPIVTDILLHIVHIFEAIARAGGPALRSFLKFLDDLAAKGERATGSSSGIARMTSFFNRGEQFAETIIRLGGAIAHLFGAIIGVSAESGATAIEDLTTQVNKATAWINAHQEQTRKFFEDARKATYDVASAVWDLVKALNQVYNPETVHELTQAFSNVLLPVLVTVIHALGAFTGLILKFMGTPIGGKIAEFALSLLLLNKVFSPMLVIFGSGIVKLGELAAALGRYRVAVLLAESGTKLLEIATGPIGLGLAAIAAAVLLLNEKFHFMHAALQAVRRVFDWFGDLVGHNPFLEIMGGVLALTAAVVGLRKALEVLRATQIGSSLLGGLGGLAGGGAGGVIGGAARRAPWSYPVAAAEGAAGGGLAAGAGRIGSLLTRGVGLGLAHIPLVAAGAAAVDSIIEGFKTGSASQGAMKGLSNVANVFTFGLIPKPKDFDKADKQVTDDLDRIQALVTEKAKARKLGINIEVNLDPNAKDRVNKFMDDLLDQLSQTVTQVKNKTETWSGYLDELRTNIGFNMKRITYLLQQGKINQAEATQAMAANYNNAAVAIDQSMRRAGRVTRDGIELMNRYFRQALRSYGMDEADIRQELEIRDYRAAHPGGSTGAQGRRTQGGTGSALAAGGWVGNQGERGRDHEQTWLGRGEAVLNWAHQKAVEPALAWAKQAGVSAYGSLNEIFSRVRGLHAGGLGDALGYASGGWATRGGINIVPIAGQGGNGTPAGTEFINAKIKNLVEGLVRRYHLLITDAFDPTGRKHKSPGHEVTGTAVDFVPGSGGSWPLLEAMGRWAVTQGLTVGYDSHIPGAQHWPDHGRGNHIHVEFGAGDAISGVAAAVRQHIRRVMVDGPRSLIRDAAQSGLDRVRTGAQRMADRAYRASQRGDAGLGTIATGGMSGPWVRVLEQIANRMHWNTGDWKWLVQAESGGNSEARNPSSGAFGLGQFLGATLRAYTKFGAASHNPVDQIKAMAQYILDRYVNPTRAKSFHLAHNWYAGGGEVPGPLGQARSVVAHAREWILPEHMQHKLATWVGTTRDQLKSNLGFTGGPTHFQGGGEVSARAARAQTFTLPANYDTSVGGLVEQSRRAFRFMDNLRLRATSFLTSFRSAFQELAGDQGIFDQMQTAVENLTKTLDAQLKRATYRVDRFGRVLLQGDDVSRTDQAVDNLEREYSALMSERGAINSTLRRITERLQRLRRGGISRSERDLYNRLSGYRRNLQTRLDNLSVDIADNIESRYNAVEAALQARVDRSQRGVDRTNARAGLAQRTRALLGARASAALGFRGPQAIAQMQADAMQIQVADLRKTMMEARRRGHTDLAQKISDQIDELNVTIAETVQKGLQDAVDEATARAQHSQQGLDLRGRLADLMEKAGDVTGAFTERGRILTDRGGVLLQQRSDIMGLRDQAAAQGQLGLVDTLNDQLADLSVQIQENTAAIAANTVAARQASIDNIIRRGGFLTGIFGSLGSLLTSVAGNTGILDVDTQRALLGQSGTTLKQTGSGLSQQLFEAYGIDVRGYTSTQLVDVLRRLDYDGIEANFSQDQRQQFEGLITSIIQNQTAVEDNTTQLQQLSATVTQTWSSTAWQWFRNAVFTGSGGLLPQFQIPHMDAGGYIRSDGLIYAHQGEKVVAANVEYSQGGGEPVFAPHVENHEKTVDMDTDTMASRLWWRYQEQGRSNRGGRRSR